MYYRESPSEHPQKVVRANAQYVTHRINLSCISREDRMNPTVKFLFVWLLIYNHINLILILSNPNTYSPSHIYITLSPCTTANPILVSHPISYVYITLSPQTSANPILVSHPIPSNTYQF